MKGFGCSSFFVGGGNLCCDIVTHRRAHEIERATFCRDMFHFVTKRRKCLPVQPDSGYDNAVRSAGAGAESVPCINCEGGIFMQQMSDDAKTCYAVLRGKTKEHLFEEEIQKMKILDVTAKVRISMDIHVVAYCVLDNELHLVMLLQDGQSADEFLNRIASSFEANCLEDGRPLRVDYLAEQNRFPNANSSVSEHGFFYSTGKKINHFRKHTIKELNDRKAAVHYCLKMHMLPVKQGIVAEPEDYWWCSYLDYQGRNWLPVAETSQILSKFSEDPKQAMKLIRQRHMEALTKNSPAL